MMALRPTLLDRVASPPAPNGHVGRAAVSVLAHIVLVAVLLRLVVPVPQKPREPLAFSLLFAPAHAPALQTPPTATQGADASALPTATPQSHQAAAVPPTPPTAQTRPVRTARVAPRAHAPSVTARQISPTAPAREPAAAVAQTAAPSLAIPTAVPDDGVALARLRDAVSEAVQAVAKMPMAARLQRREGRAQVGFAYQDGTVADATLLRSSQSRLLDEAALTAVRLARYPAPPVNLRGRRLTLQIWIDFTMDAQTQS